jgi:N-lysine methyltransferase SETD6
MEEDASEYDFTHRSANFLNWLRYNGTTISSKIELADLRNHDAGRGIIALEDLGEDEQLFSIARSSILTVETSSLPTAIKDQLEDPWLSLILVMAYESQLGANSAWKPYFDVLPIQFDTLMYWSEEELRFLQGSAVVNKIGKKSADKAFAEQLLPILREYNDTFHASDRSDEDVLALFHRMGSAIMAYAFDLENPSQQPAEGEDGWGEDSDAGESLPKGMVPLADMLNADADRNNAKLFYEEDKVVMKTIKVVQKGQELFNDYGPLPRADLLRRYGYITDNYAKYDVAEISLDLIKTIAAGELQIPASDIETRIDYLDEHGALDDSFDISRPSDEEEEFPPELIVLVNTLCLSAPEYDKLSKKEKLPKPELGTESAKLLHTILKKRLKAYSHSFNPQESAHDQAASTADQSQRRPQMARVVIMGEQNVLREALDSLNSIVNETSGRKRNVDETPAKPNGEKKRKTK